MNKQQKQEIEEWRRKVARQEKTWNEFIETKIKEFTARSSQLTNAREGEQARK